ncbi:MAG: UvrB/UvrC motif-containing protein [Candidatus Omnitrophica bacterium]|nr:UvrB/UvrC motif-containing protein [Candidatus Omnitrophota bacterium]
MKCDLCEQPATVHLTEIVDGVMTELHLCEECARKKSAQMEQQFGLSDLLAGMAEFGKPAKEVETTGVKCPNCGLGYADFKKVGRLGCGSCYGTFRKYLMPLLKRIHGSSQHVGKHPPSAPAKPKTAKRRSVLKERSAGPKDTPVRPSGQKIPAGQKELNELRLRLQRAIETEAFEEAAKIRDQIKALEKEIPHETK